MQGLGFGETTQPAYQTGDPTELVGGFRRFGERGPAYEVMRIVDGNEAWIRVVYTGEELSYPIADLLQDPIAETIP